MTVDKTRGTDAGAKALLGTLPIATGGPARRRDGSRMGFGRSQYRHTGGHAGDLDPAALKEMVTWSVNDLRDRYP
ncbi:MAG: hypothetical protein JST66_00355 [Bacteroidetes bacterium]|nr:hypothetical protein [Bacteroidota bacterium]